MTLGVWTLPDMTSPPGARGDGRCTTDSPGPAWFWRTNQLTWAGADRYSNSDTEWLAMYLADVVRRGTREVRDVLRAETPTHGYLRDRIVAIMVATVGADLICAVLAFSFEVHARGTQIHSFAGALFWTSTQLLTVSSSLQNPITPGGRILDVAMELYAITVVASMAGAIGAFMIKRGHENQTVGRSEAIGVPRT